MISLNWYFPSTDTAEGTKNMLLQHFFYKGCFLFSSKARQSYEHSHWCFTQNFWWLETGQKEHLLSSTGYSPGWTMSLLMSVKSYWTWKINLLQICVHWARHRPSVQLSTKLFFCDFYSRLIYLARDQKHNQNRVPLLAAASPAAGWLKKKWGKNYFMVWSRREKQPEWIETKRQQGEIGECCKCYCTVELN